MPIPHEVINDIKLKKPEPLTKTVKVIVEAHQTRINIPSEISVAMKIKQNDKMELTFDNDNLDILTGKLLRFEK